MLRISIMALAMMMAIPAFAEWEDVLEEARGQTVYWNAWGGDARTNAFIEWVSSQTEERYGVSVEQVKLSDTAEAVNRVLSEKAAGRDEDGSVDLIWINGPNFYAMKSQDLLFGPFAQELPNAKYVDWSDGSAASLDFTVPTEGYEAPWRLAKFVFSYDSARVETPPKTMTDLLVWAQENPGRFTHPQPSDFMGATFLKQALIATTSERDALMVAPNERSFGEVTDAFWQWYDAMHPLMWREGKSFPENQFALQNLLNDGEVDFAMSFDPNSTAAAILDGQLPDTVRVFAPDIGSIGNISFTAIPFNAAHKAGAQVVANFLLSPEAQAHMQNIEVLGSFSVLDPARLNDDEAQLFKDLPNAPARPSLEELGATLPEPHPKWMTMLVEEWQNRYGG